MFGKGQLLAVAEEVGSDRCHGELFATFCDPINRCHVRHASSTMLNPAEPLP